MEMIRRQKQSSGKSDSKKQYLTYSVYTNTLFADVLKFYKY